MGDIMAKKEEYEKLYMIDGNREESVDYELLSKTYISYLSIFLTGPGEYKNFKGNLSFLYDVVNGFDYYQNKLFDDSYVDDLTLVNYINSKSMGIMIGSISESEEEKDELLNEIYKVTYSCHDLVSRINHPFTPIIIRQMFSNACNIESTFNKYKGNYKGM